MSAKLTPALRPMLPDDGPVLAAIFRAAVEEIASEDYSQAQCDAWAARADDEEAFAAMLASGLTIIATLDKEPVGFATLKDNAHVDMLYVHPGVAHRGVATALLDALETIAASRGTALMTADASDTARELFAKRGYVAMRRNSIELDGEWLGNTSMEKRLEPLNKGPLQ